MTGENMPAKDWYHESKRNDDCLGPAYRTFFTNAIVWQCRRTADDIEKLVKDGLADYVRKTTGLIPDGYFSASKKVRILDHVGARKAEAGDLLLGRWIPG